MRRALREVIAPFTSARPTTGPTEHIGLSYGAWAPTGRPDGAPGDEGKVPDKLPGNDKCRSNWLAAVAATPIHPHYQHSFDRWEASLRGDSRHRLAVIDRGCSSATATPVLQKSVSPCITLGAYRSSLAAHSRASARLTSRGRSAARSPSANPIAASNGRGNELSAVRARFTQPYSARPTLTTELKPSKAASHFTMHFMSRIRRRAIGRSPSMS